MFVTSASHICIHLRGRHYAPVNKDCFSILILGVIAFFTLMLGLLAFGFFGLGAIVYGFAIFSDRPLTGIMWIIIGAIILGIFSKIDKR